MKNSNWFSWLKIAAAVFNGIATYSVFYEIFRTGERGILFSFMSAVLSVILVDLFFLVALLTLENKEVPIRERLVWSVSAALLAFAVLGIGVSDEGLLGIVPRVGFCLLVFQDIISVYAEYSEHYHSRTAQEQRIRDRQVILRRKEVAAAYKRMITSQEMRSNFEEREKQRELANLGYKEESTSYSNSIPQPVLDNFSEIVEPNIIQLTSGGYGWVDPEGEVNSLTALGKPYTLQGARSALSRASKHNGHNA